MITGPKSMFIARCKQRGHSWDSVQACIVSEDGGMVTVDETHPAYPKGPEPPGLAQRLLNFASSAVSHVASGMPMCTQEQVDQRFAICQACEFYKDGGCLKCGCPLVREKKFISKLSWANEKCPVGKWGPVGQ